MYKLFCKIRKYLSVMQISSEFKTLFVKSQLIESVYMGCASYMVLFLQYANEALQRNEIYMAMCFLIIYLSRDFLRDIASGYLDELREQVDEKRVVEFEKNSNTILSYTLGKVIKEKNSIKEEMKIIEAREALENYWRNFDGVVDLIISIITFIVCLLMLAFGISGTINTSLNWWILITVFGLRILVTKIYAKKSKPIIEEEKEARKGNKLIKNDIENVNAINKNHFMYMVNKGLVADLNEISVMAKSRKLRRVESVWHSALTVALILWIFWEQMSIQGFSVYSVVQILATIKVYNEMFYRIERGINVYGKITQCTNRMQTYAEDVDLIYDAYEKEKEIKERKNNVSQIQMEPFNFSYADKYMLMSTQQITLNAGEVSLFKGATGSGKSTLMEIITGKLQIGDKIKYFPEEDARVQSLSYSSKDKLGTGNVIEEICFTDKYDETKLKEILLGLNIYQEIQEKESNVFEYLANSVKDKFSTGQQQRLVIARLLYNLQPNVEVVVFDEATNALNDAIAERVLTFALGYIQRERARICLIASHQVNVVAKYANKIYSIKSVGNAVFKVKAEKTISKI